MASREEHTEELQVSQANLLQDFLSQIKRIDHKLLSDDIPEEKAGEIKSLLGGIGQQYEKLKMLKEVAFSNAATAERVLLADLTEKYILGKDSTENPAATVPFGLANLVIQGDETKAKKCEKCNFAYEKNFDDEGEPAEVNFPSNYLMKKFELMELQVDLHNNYANVRRVMKDYENTLSEVMKLKALQEQSIADLGKALSQKAQYLALEADTALHETLRDYFTEDEGVPEASRILKDKIENDMQKMKLEQVELQEKLDAYKKLEGSSFNRILKEYQETLVSIERKKWILQEFKKNRAEVE